MQAFAPQRRYFTVLVALVTVSLAVVVAVGVARIVPDDTSVPSAGVDTPAATPTTTDPRGAVNDAGVNPWAFNDPATVLRFLEERCPGGPPVTAVDDLLPALQACVASTPS